MITVHNKLIKQMTKQQLTRSLALSQGIFIFTGIILSIFFFEGLNDWLEMFNLDVRQIIVYGVWPSIIVVLIDILLLTILPDHAFNDGGINRAIFQDRSIGYIFVLTLSIAIAEELLFRGVIQSVAGYFVASIIFALVHVRYLRNPYLLISVVVLSFLLGYLFVITGNLIVTITTHFIINFLLGLIIRSKNGVL